MLTTTRVATLQPGVRLTAIFDSCHSGSALDLPYIYSTQGVLKEPNLAKEAGQGLLGIVSSYARGDLGGMASTAMGLFKKATSGDDAYKRNLRTKTSPADVIMWSGSKDSQTSYVNLNFSDEPSYLGMRHDSVMLSPEDLMCFASPMPSLDVCYAPSIDAFEPFRDMHGNILI